MTGNTAMIGQDGNVHFQGRYKHVIIRAGRNISPASIEYRLAPRVRSRFRRRAEDRGYGQNFTLCSASGTSRPVHDRTDSQHQLSGSFIFRGNHAVFNALWPVWLEDLDAALRSEGAPPAFLNMRHRMLLHKCNTNRETVQEVQEASAYHCTRLKGVSRCLRALWPYQRASQWFKGND